MKLITTKVIIATLLLFCATFSYSQKTVYIISFEENWGLTDRESVEIVAPIYDWYDNTKDKKLYVFKPHYTSDKNVLLYNAVTGEISKNFKRIYLDDAKIDKQSYHYFDDDKKSYLQNSQTGEIIKTKEDVYSIKNLGSKYLFAQFSPTEKDFPKPPPPKPKPVKAPPTVINPKTGKIIPPPPSPMPPPPPLANHDSWMRAYAFYSNTSPLKTILKIEAQSFIPLYYAEEENSGTVQIITEYNRSDFDYLAFKKNKQIYLYDENLVLIKKFPYPHKDDRDEINSEFVSFEVSKFLDKGIVHFRPVYPNVARQRSENEETPKDPFYTKKTSDGFYELIRTSDDKICFSSQYKIEYDPSNNRIAVTGNDKKISRFYIDEISGKPFYPKKYLGLLKIKTE